MSNTKLTLHIPDRTRSKSRARDSDSDSNSSHSSSEDSDDAPLATLMRPPRPGSSASNATSGSRSRMPTKPLIDISQMGTPPVPPFIAGEKTSSPLARDKQFSPPIPDKDSISSASSPETRPIPRPTHCEKPSISDRLARVAQGTAAKSVEQLASAAPLERKSFDTRPALSDDSERGRVAKPARSQTAPFGKLEERDPSTPPAKPKPNGRTMSSPNAAALYDLTDTTPIVPTLIRERSPPPAFSVTSRPASQLSLNSQGRLSGSHSTVRVVGSGSTASSPTSPASVTSFSRPAESSPEPRSPPFASMAPSKSSNSSSTPPSRPSPGGRQRSSTLIPNRGLPDSSGFTGTGLLASSTATPSDSKSNPISRASPPSAMRGSRQRSSTMLPQVDTSPLPRMFADRESSASSNSSRVPQSAVSTSTSSQAPSSSHRFPQRPRVPFSNSSSSSPSASSPQSGIPPPKPFAVSDRGNSPASSTGDSSSGRTPLTPADGSDVGYADSRSAVSGVTAPRKGHKRGGSVTFEDEPAKDRGRPKANMEEERRKERRRSEAKAAIEVSRHSPYVILSPQGTDVGTQLGKVVNGKISLPSDDDEDLPLNGLAPRMSMANPMMNFTPPSPMNFSPNVGNNMMAPQFMMPPPNADPRFLAAHQHAMMVAKQAYQMAVAQQALAAANDEWERGSSASAFGGMSMNMGVPNMAPMPGMAMPMYGMGWNTPMMFPSSASMYAGSVAGSELGVGGGGGGGGGWGSRSEYGGPSRNSRTSALMSSRSSTYGFDQQSTASTPNRPPLRPRTKTAPSDAPLPPQHRARQAPPPSSWKKV